MNAPDPLGDLDKLANAGPSGSYDPGPQGEFLLRQILSRLIRLETRLVRLMLHHGVAPDPRNEIKDIHS